MHLGSIADGPEASYTKEPSAAVEAKSCSSFVTMSHVGCLLRVHTAFVVLLQL